MFGELLDRIAAMQQHTLVTVDIGDLRFTGCGRRKPGIVGEGSRVLVECTDIDDIRSNRAFSHGQVD